MSNEYNNINVELRNIISLFVNSLENTQTKLDNTEKKLDNLHDKLDDLSIIKHQVSQLERNSTEVLEDLQDLKSIEYKVETLLEWKKNVDQNVTVNDLIVIKNKVTELTNKAIQLNERLDTIFEEVKKEISNKSIISSGATSGILTLIIEGIKQFFKIS